jgi:glucose-6-phosphate 1-dehydrogenase
MNDQTDRDPTDRTAFIIFGVTGDLTSRKLIPALYELALAQRLPEDLFLIGFARRDWDDAALRSHLYYAVMKYARSQPVDETVLAAMLANVCYVQSTFDDPDGYYRLDEYLEEMRIGNRLLSGDAIRGIHHHRQPDRSGRAGLLSLRLGAASSLKNPTGDLDRPAS